MTDKATLTLVEQLIRLGKGVITALEKWLEEQKAQHATR